MDGSFQNKHDVNSIIQAHKLYSPVGTISDYLHGIHLFKSDSI